MLVLARVRSSTHLTMTAQAVEGPGWPFFRGLAGNIPGRTQTVAVAIYDAVESGNGALARVLVLVVSAVALLVLSVANRLSARHAV